MLVEGANAVSVWYLPEVTVDGHVGRFVGSTVELTLVCRKEHGLSLRV